MPVPVERITARFVSFASRSRILLELGFTNDPVVVAVTVTSPELTKAIAVVGFNTSTYFAVEGGYAALAVVVDADMLELVFLALIGIKTPNRNGSGSPRYVKHQFV